MIYKILIITIFISIKVFSYEKIEGFNNVKFSDMLFSNKIIVGENDKIKCYKRKNELLILNNVTFENILYCFYENEMISIVIILKDINDTDKMKEYFEKKYGKFYKNLYEEFNEEKTVTKTIYIKNIDKENSFFILFDTLKYIKLKNDIIKEKDINIFDTLDELKK